MDESLPLLPFPAGCLRGRLVRRAKRFSVLVETPDGRVWVHCNNSGSMLGLLRPGNDILASPAANPRRKLAWTLELIRSQGVWVGVNTLAPNRLLRAAWQAGLLDWAQGFDTFRAEAKVGQSRLDALLESNDGRRLWVEAKNVTMVEDQVACFPDAATERGRKHLEELAALARRGDRAVCFYLVQRADGQCFGPADFIDPAYAEAMWRVMEAGVEIRPHLALVTPRGIGLGPRLDLAGRSG